MILYKNSFVLETSKYMVVSPYQNAGRTHNIKIDNSSFKIVEHFKYLGKILEDQNSIQEGNKGSLKLGNACYYSVKNILSFSLLYKLYKD
jgi:hypothetical protein